MPLYQVGADQQRFIMHKIELPFPPSVNSLFGGGSKQKRFKSKKYKAWINSCPDIPASLYSNIGLCYNFYMPDNRTRDLDNHAKAVSDYLVANNFIFDDSWQCLNKLVLMHSGIDKKNPRVEITIL